VWSEETTHTVSPAEACGTCRARKAAQSTEGRQRLVVPAAPEKKLRAQRGARGWYLVRQKISIEHGGAPEDGGTHRARKET